MLYIFLTGQVRLHPGSTPLTPYASTMPQKLVRLGEAVTERVDDPGILSLRDLERIIWSNLERINSMLYSVG